MIGLTSIFTLWVSRFSMTALCRCFKSSLVFQGKSRFHGNSCHSCYAAEISRTCQLRELWKSKFFRLRPPRSGFYCIHSGLTPEFVVAFFFIPHVFVRFYYISHFTFLSLARFTLLHVYNNAEYTYTEYCFNAVPSFHKHLSRRGRVKSIGLGVKEQLMILNQVVN